MRVAVVGHRVWFENHFPEGWEADKDLLCLDVDERNYSWLMVLLNFRPDITIFYRPELYPERYLRHVTGIRVAVLSEPLPLLIDGQMQVTEETALRLAVYRGMAWDAYHWRIYYDPGKERTAAALGFRIDEFRSMPIDTKSFHPPRRKTLRPFDVCFVGKATSHRIAKLDFLRSSNLRFIWVAHGISGVELAHLFRRSRVVLNVHADGVAALEPRLYLAAACGCRVVSEELSSCPAVLRSRIVQDSRIWTEETMREHVSIQSTQRWTEADELERLSLSVRLMIETVYTRFQPVASILS